MIRRPSSSGWASLIVGAAAFAGAISRAAGEADVRSVVLTAGCLGVLVALRRTRLALSCVVVALTAGRPQPEPAVLEPGWGTIQATVSARPSESAFGWTTRVKLLRQGTGTVVVFSDARPTADLGDRVVVTGMRVNGTRGPAIRDADFSVVSESAMLRLPNRLRERVLGELATETSASRALLAGFLVGHTSDIPAADQESLRRSGLSHFTAVSGSNVALFLGLWSIMLGPVGWTPRRRAVSSLVGTLIFAAVTGFDPSVIRAGAMVWVVMIGRLLGLPVDGWSALGVAVTGAILVGPALALSLGFQLSVAATLGVMSGAGLFGFRPRWAAIALSASLAAQAAVSPLLLAGFGSVPLLSPVANVVATPLVALATIIGGIGALSGCGVLIALGSALARAVLVVAEAAAGWPQVGWIGFVVVGTGVVSARFVSRSRGPLVVAGGVWLLAALGPFGARVDPPALVFLDVGQGDAAVLLTGAATVLIDGGPDPAALSVALRRLGVRKVDLVVVSHSHADHIDGLEAVFGRLPVGAVWAAFDPHESPSSRWVDLRSRELGIPLVSPPVGFEVDLGGAVIEVLAPARRYAHTNDQSIVLRITGSERHALLTGDIEAIAQEADYSPVDILKVPHHGSDSSDPGWLSRHAGNLAVISVGDNDYGHPSDGVISLLVESGAVVHRTDRDGDLVVELDRPPP